LHVALACKGSVALLCNLFVESFACPPVHRDLLRRRRWDLPGPCRAVIFRGRAVAVLRRPPLLFRPPPRGRATASSTGRCCHLTRGCDARWDLPGGALAGRDGSPSGPLLLRDSVFFRAFVPLIFFFLSFSCGRIFLPCAGSSVLVARLISIESYRGNPSV